MQNTKNIIKYLILGGIFITPFIAFIVPQGMFFPFITGKGFVFRILVEIIFGLYVVLAFMDRGYRPKLSWITKSVLIFTLAILVADLLGVSPYKSIWSNYERMEGFVLLIHLVMFYIVLSSVFKTKEKWHQLWNTSIIASVIMSVYALFQLAGKIAINQGGVRVDATFGNSSYLAIYLVFHIFLCIYMMVQETKEKWYKWVYGSITVLEIIILYYTATRGAILGLIGGLLLTGILLVFTSAEGSDGKAQATTGGEAENKSLRKTGFWFSGVVVALVLGFILFHNSSFVKKSPVLSRFSTLGISEFQTQGRYFVWPMAVKGVAERPIFGWGQENFNFVFNKNYNPGMFGQEEWFDRTHDLVLDWLIAGGVVGLLTYLGILVFLFYYIWRRQSVLKLAEKSILTGMIFAYIFHNIFVFDNLISYIIFFSLLSYVHSSSVSQTEMSSKFYDKVFSAEVTSYIVVPIVGVLSLGMIYFVNVPALLANRTLIQAITPQKEGGVEKNLALFKQVFDYNSFGSSEILEQLVQITEQVYATPQGQIPDNIKQQFFDFTKLKLEEKVKQSPHDARYLVFAGSFFNRFGQYDEAIKYLDRALTESPNKQSIYFELGSSYLGKGDKTKMFELFKTAYELKPTELESQVVYTIGAIYTNNAAVLNEMSPKIPQETIIYDNRFVQTYSNIGDWNSVIAILNVRLQKDPKNLQNQYTLASAYVNIGQKDKAISIIRAMIAQEPSFKDQGEAYIKQIQTGK
ncbi:MAG TPA: O-antigen ligase family protein [Candidatus Paceibacterota bacterium]